MDEINNDEEVKSVKGRKSAIDGLGGQKDTILGHTLEGESGVTSTRPEGRPLVLRSTVDVKYFGNFGIIFLSLLNMLSALMLESWSSYPGDALIGVTLECLTFLET